VTNGNRFETYAIEGERGSGVICINGAAARMVAPKDLVIIACFVGMDDAEAASHEPRLIFVDERNRMIPTRSEIAGQGTLKKVAW
jgi:aspartate 1-decarboxylase